MDAGPHDPRRSSSVKPRPPEVGKRGGVQQFQEARRFEARSLRPWRQGIEILAPLTATVVGNDTYRFDPDLVTHRIDCGVEIGDAVDQAVGQRLWCAIDTPVG